MKEYYCRICGLKQGEPIWGKDNSTPIYEICDCCGAEFGNDDYSIESIIRYRNQWVVGGFKWFNKRLKPEFWSPQKQILNILPKYRENES